MKIRRASLSLTLCTILLAAASFTTARAQDGDEPRRQVNATAPVSLAEGQTFRINFFNAGKSPFEIIPCVFDGDGAHLKTWEIIKLSPGQTLSFDLSRAEAGRRTEPSVQVRAGVHVDDSNLKYLVTSGEVVDDASSRTNLFVSGANPPNTIRTGEQAPPDPVLPDEVTRSLAPVGITDGQLLRVNFLNVGSSPLEIIPCIFDGDGAHLKTGALLLLNPGQTISFEMNRAEAGPRAESRLVVRGAAHIRNDDKNLLITGEVIEATTGRSSLLVPGTRVGFDPQPDPPKTN